MTIYLAVLAIIGYFSIFLGLSRAGSSSRQRLQTYFSVLVSILLILILALRGSEIGVDVPEYLSFWALAESNDLFEISRFEPAFVGLTVISRHISDSPQFYLTLIAVLSIIPVGYTIRKLSPKPLLSWTIFICLGFYSFAFSGLRQAIALAIVTLSLRFIQKRRLFLFLAAIAVAWTFHLSALVFLPAYWVYRIKISSLTVAAYFVGTALLIVTKETIFRWFASSFFPTYEVTQTGAYSWLLISAGIVFLGWYLLSKKHDQSTNTEQMRVVAEGLLKIATVGVTLMIFASIGTNVMRIADYYYLAIIFAYPAIFEINSSKLKPIMQVSFIAALVTIYLTQMLQSPYSIVPYKLFVS